MDNAGHRQCALVMSEAAVPGIELPYPPACSPNLNLIERLWKLVKTRRPTNRHHENFEKFRAATGGRPRDPNGVAKAQLNSLPTLTFHSFGNLQSQGTRV